ncbi:MAG: histidine phosphatase family protein [Acidimicrobiales bacterium]
MDLVLIRHARPVRIDDANGPADPELTELGHRQAKAMATWMADEHFDALYVSPMLRARQTSHPLENALSLTAEVVDGVQEYDALENSYIPMEDLKADKARWRQFIADQQLENMSEFSDLVVASIEDLIGRHRGDRIGVVCHGGVVNVWAANVLGLGPQMFFEPHYTSVSRFVAASSGERSIDSLNEVPHLRGLE